ncbi:MAG: endonuclease V [Candidatus Brockarchaeota archaeon]|nr:endonuclease V [Candidatus Brockarchaeota archaeon]
MSAVSRRAGRFSAGRAEEAQRRLGALVEIRELPSFPPRVVAGVDVHYEGSRACAAVAFLEYASLRELKTTTALSYSPLDYFPGFLAFKEAPAIFKALERCEKPDVLLVNGHGVCHPRGCGLATHVGVVEKVPTIGVALGPLAGARPGSFAKIERGQSSLYVSVGNLITLEQAEKVVRRLLAPESKLPLPLYLAHRAARLAARSRG